MNKIKIERDLLIDLIESKVEFDYLISEGKITQSSREVSHNKFNYYYGYDYRENAILAANELEQELNPQCAAKTEFQRFQLNLLLLPISARDWFVVKNIDGTVIAYEDRPVYMDGFWYARRGKDYRIVATECDAIHHETEPTRVSTYLSLRLS